MNPKKKKGTSAKYCSKIYTFYVFALHYDYHFIYRSSNQNTIMLATITAEQILRNAIYCKENSRYSSNLKFKNK